MVVEEKFAGWRRHVPACFECCRESLEHTEGSLAEILLVHSVGKHKDRSVLLGNPDYARSSAMEEVDCGVSGGHFMVSTDGRGVETRRPLEPAQFPEVEWLGSSEFHAYYRGRLRQFCMNEVRALIPRNRNRVIVSTDDVRFDRGTLAVQPNESDGVRDDVIFELSRFVEILLRRQLVAVAETAEGIVRVLQNRAGAGALESDHYGFWRAVGDQLGLSEDALAQRKKRFYQQIGALRGEISPWLFMRAIGMVTGEAVSDIGACEATLQLAGAPCRDTVDAIRDFLLRSMADQHPMFTGKPLSEIRNTRVTALVDFGGRPHAYRWPPSAMDFAAFCETNRLRAGRQQEELINLHEELLKMKPRPTRMISVLRSVFGGDALFAKEKR